jgi:hypothetical protein
MGRKLSSFWRAKLIAFGTHLAISVTVFAAVVALSMWLFYPPLYFWIDGGLFVLSIAAGVDVALGPSFTLVLYAPGRRSNRFVLPAIALAQVAALGWGVHLMYEQRPLLDAYVDYPRHEFFPVTQALIADSPRPLTALLALSPERPALVYVALPADHKRAAQELQSGRTLSHTDSYMPLTGSQLKEVLDAGRTRKHIESTFPGNMPRVQKFIDHHGGSFDDYAFVPLAARFGRALLVFRRSDGKLVGAIALKLS